MNSNGPGMPPHDPSERELLAAEYVLGVLDAQTRREAQRRIANEPGFAAEVAAWEARLAPMLDDVAPVSAPTPVWPRISAALGHDAPVRATKPRPLWDSLPFWRGVGATGFAMAAAAFVFIAVQRPPAAPAGKPMVVAIRHDDGSPAYSATFDAQRSMLVLMPLDGSAGDDGRVPQLWLIPSSDGKPRSLGVIDRRNAMMMRLSPAMRDAIAGGVMAVSLEPAGGSPTGQPTGPVIAKGNVVGI